METLEMLARIDEIVKQNKLDVHKKFNSEYLARNSFYSDAQAIANEAIAKILDFCVIGINGGFNKEVRNAISDLSKTVVTLTTVKNGETKKLNSCKGQVEKVIFSGKNQVAVDPISEIKSYITTTIGAIDAVIKNKELFGNSVDAQRENLEEVKQKLTQLEAKLDEVHNFTSKMAADKAMSITKEILIARLDISRLFVSLDTVAHLDNALRIANEWTKLAAATGKKEVAKAEDFPKYEPDNISTLASSDKTFNKIDLFRQRFAEAESRITNPVSVQNCQKRLDEINVELAKIAQEEQAVVIEFKNTGDRAKAERQASELKARKTRLQKEMPELQRQINMHRQTNAARIKIVDTFKRGVYEPLMSDMQDDPLSLCVTVELMDLGSILSMLGRSFNEADVKAATETLIRAKIKAKQQLETLINTSREFGIAEDLLDQKTSAVLDELDQIDGITVDEPQTQSVSALDELLGNVTVTPNPTDSILQQNTTQQTGKTSIPLTDDDK